VSVARARAGGPRGAPTRSGGGPHKSSREILVLCVGLR
jgi:hypothetical protein